MEPSLRIVFRGQIVEGFDPQAVKQTAAARLGATPLQIEQMFSGRQAILKKGLGVENGARYLALLEHIGMRAQLEPEPGIPAAATSVPPPAPAPTPAAPAPKSEPFDPERTHIAGAAEIDRYLAALGDSEQDAPATEMPLPKKEVPMICAKCGERQPAANFCRRCGHAVSQPVQTVQASAAEASAAPVKAHRPMPVIAPTTGDLGPTTVFSPVVTAHSQGGPDTQMPDKLTVRTHLTDQARRSGTRRTQWIVFGTLFAAIAYTAYWVFTRY